MRKLAIGLLAASGIALAAPANAQGFWAGGPGFSVGVGFGPSYGYGGYYGDPYWGGGPYASVGWNSWDHGWNNGWNRRGYRYYDDYAYGPSFGYGPSVSVGFGAPAYGYGYAQAPNAYYSERAYRNANRYPTGTLRSDNRQFAQPRSFDGGYASVGYDGGYGAGWGQAATMKSSGAGCWVSTDDTRGLGYYGRCRTSTVDTDAALGQARPNVDRVGPRR